MGWRLGRVKGGGSFFIWEMSEHWILMGSPRTLPRWHQVLSVLPSAFPPQEKAAHSQMLGPEARRPSCPLTGTLLSASPSQGLQRMPRARSLLTTPFQPSPALPPLTVTTALAFDPPLTPAAGRPGSACRPPPPVIHRAARVIGLLHKIRPCRLSAWSLLLASPPEQKAEPQVTCEDTHEARSHSAWRLTTRATHAPSCP